MKDRGEGDRGKIFVVSGPSGSGKTTLVNRLKSAPGICYSVSTTSRAPRPGEVEGGDYVFVTRHEFERMISRGEFAEHAEVAGNLYGTPKARLLEGLESGKRVLVDIDVQGAMQIRSAFPEATLIFIEPPSMEVLEQRLRDRGTESEEALRRRLSLARREMEYARRYDYRIVNDELDRAADELKQRIFREDI